MRVRRAQCAVFMGLLWAVLGGRAATSAQQAPTQNNWADQDIGNPAITGSATPTAGGFSVTSGGKDIWGNSDQFHFVYQPVSGNVDVRARVDSVTEASTWSKAGVMIRGSLAADSAHGFALVSAAKGTAFQRRQQDGSNSTNTSGVSVAPPEWVRIVRIGSTVSAYTSPDGSQWSLIGSDTIQLPATAYVGLAVTSHNTSVATTASLSQISVAPIGLPAGQFDADIGSPAIAGAAGYANGTYQIQAGGADIWGTADQFHFVYQQVTGDVDVSLRVASISYTSSWAKAGVMIRETLDPGSAHGFALLSAGRGYAFQRRDSTGASSVSTAGTAGSPPGWVRLTRTGSLLTAYQSSDGQNWTVIGSDSVPMAETVYVGIAVASHNVSVPTDVTADSFTVTSTQTNQAPTVSITSPSAGATFTAPASITLTANASDPQNQLTNVAFYNGSTLLGTVTTAPYTYTWSSVAAGTYSLTAVASDAAGLSTTSAAVSVTVTAAPKAPTVALTSPTSGATFTAPASITLTASASDPQNQLTKVAFYNGSTLLGTVTAAPYTFTWSAVAAGTYSLTAVASDAAGLSTTSSAASVTVTGPKAPTVTLTSPTSGATFTAPASITLTASASDPQNQLTNVAFYNGSTRLGTVTAAPYTYTWASVAAGTYSLTAVASDAAGLSTTSTAVSVTVTAAPKAPTVSLTSPTSGATFTAPAAITLTASASDPQNQLTKVAFYNGSTLLGTVTAAPYTFTWSSVAAGTYSLTAVASDAAGLSTTSAAVSVTVAAPKAPTVSLTSPTSGATFTAPASITLSANASDPQNQLTKVAFYNGSTLLGTVTAAPYSFTWASVAAGTYSLTAVASDAAGLSTTSAAVSVTVSTVTTPPTAVSFTASADNASVTSYEIDIFAAGADPNSATPVATLNAGKPTPDPTNTITVSAPSFFSALAPGTYQLTVSAIDAGGVGRSAAISFTR